MSRIKWGLKQLLPFSYRSHYSIGKDKVFTVWNMWLGKCFKVESVNVCS